MHQARHSGIDSFGHSTAILSDCDRMCGWNRTKLPPELVTDRFDVREFVRYLPKITSTDNHDIDTDQLFKEELEESLHEGVV